MVGTSTDLHIVFCTDFHICSGCNTQKQKYRLFETMKIAYQRNQWSMKYKLVNKVKTPSLIHPFVHEPDQFMDVWNCTCAGTPEPTRTEPCGVLGTHGKAGWTTVPPLPPLLSQGHLPPPWKVQEFCCTLLWAPGHVRKVCLIYQLQIDKQLTVQWLAHRDLLYMLSILTGPFDRYHKTPWRPESYISLPEASFEISFRSVSCEAQGWQDDQHSWILNWVLHFICIDILFEVSYSWVSCKGQGWQDDLHRESLIC